MMNDAQWIAEQIKRVERLDPILGQFIKVREDFALQTTQGNQENVTNFPFTISEEKSRIIKVDE